ncbi:hypothetical protein [Phocaeicola coprocola]|uniref:hypothetical protein n=1 Tax=Phocaeicola coprocola TaxID=310298 RepID=UPI002672AAF9|nr:hypothetical protein [Phocaeicola coprocola]
MEPVYIDLHIHTSKDANNPNLEYDIAELVRRIKDINGNSDYLISFTDHNMINKSAYMKAKALGVNVILGAELHIKLHADVKSYHCHIFFNSLITEENIDGLNLILNKLYPNKLPNRDDDSIPDIQEIINSFDGYDFMLLPHGSQAHGAFNYSLHEGERIDNAINRSIYYNQFDGFTARSNRGLENTQKYFQKLGIGEFVNLITCSDNYNPQKYPEPHSKESEPFIPTWMFAEPSFDGVRLSLSESTRLIYQYEKPVKKSEFITSVKLINENIDIDVNLTEGLNVVIGSSSSGKTLFVDSIVRAIEQNFEYTNYMKYGVDSIKVVNPSGMHPYYISQNFISENINSRQERSIDKIEILKNIFPGDEKINKQITNVLNNLNLYLSELFQCVDTIERTNRILNAIPHPGKLIIYGAIRKNLYLPLLPSEEEISFVAYENEQYEEDIRNLKRIASFLDNNPFTKKIDNELNLVLQELEVAKNAYSLFQEVNQLISKTKIAYDNELQKVQGINQDRVENKERLLDNIKTYINAIKRFDELKRIISDINYTYDTNCVESMGHTLSIRNNFKFDLNVMLDCLNRYLKPNFTSLKDITPEKLSSMNFKERPKVESYQDLAQKIYVYLCEKNTKSYHILSKNKEDFHSLSPGWKTAILLDLILGYKEDNAPIIIDQPEDNLAVKYINEDLVKTIKQVKDRKQIILVSHNATIPMMADAQNIIYCKNVNGKIVIRSALLEGQIEDHRVLDIIAEQTDGGKASIKKRVKKYNLKKYN